MNVPRREWHAGLVTRTLVDFIWRKYATLNPRVSLRVAIKPGAGTDIEDRKSTPRFTHMAASSKLRSPS